MFHSFFSFPNSSVLLSVLHSQHVSLFITPPYSISPSIHPLSTLPPGSAAIWVSICLLRGWWSATWPVGGASRRQRRQDLSSWRLQWHPWTRVETEMRCYSNMTLPSVSLSDSTTTHTRETRWNHCAAGQNQIKSKCSFLFSSQV